MYLYDFQYDGQKLSDLGYIVCEFDKNGGVDESRTGSEVSFITAPRHDGKRVAAVGTKYDKCLSTSFQICKDPGKYAEDERRITDEEFRALSRWLNRREYLPFSDNVSAIYCDTEVASGAVASFTDGAENIPVLDLSVAITPAQSFNGYDKPWPAGGGENILDPNIKFPTGTQFGLTLTSSDGYTFSYTGTADSSGNIQTNAIATEDAVILPAGTYISRNGTLSLYKANGSWLRNQYSGTPFTVDEPFFVKNLYWQIVSGNTYNASNFIALAKGSTAPSSWSPYSNVCPITGWTGANVYHEDEYDAEADPSLSVSWQSEAGTVYGGTLDVTTGVLTVDRAIVSYDSSNGFALHSSGRWYKGGGLPSGFDFDQRTKAISNEAQYGDKNQTYAPWFAAGSQGIYINRLSLDETIEQFDTRLQEDPFQICYYITTPATYQLTATEVKTLLGGNAIWADTGDVSVEYYVNDEATRKSLSGYKRTWYNASFNLSRVEIDGVCYGVKMDMVTDAPFGYGDEENVSLSFSSGALSKSFDDLNDEIGEMYPDVVITCGSAGNLVLTDDVTGCSFEVDNCSGGEVITQSGDVMIISTSSTTHDISNDFNYDFFRFGNTYSSRTNTVTASIPCTVSITYRPIIKDTL